MRNFQNAFETRKRSFMHDCTFNKIEGIDLHKKQRKN